MDNIVVPCFFDSQYRSTGTVHRHVPRHVLRSYECCDMDPDPDPDLDPDP